MTQQILLRFPTRWCAALLLALVGMLPLAARVWTVDEVPMPYLNDARRYVSNPEGLLSAATTDSIDRLLFALERDKGVQTVVMVLDKIEGDDPYEFAMSIARKYGVGNRQKRTGLVVLLAVGDRSYQFLTGNGLEATLPDAKIQQIEDRLFVPRLKAKDWDGAMLTAMRAIDQICRGDDSLVRGAEADSEGNGTLVLFTVVVIFFAFIAIAWYAESVKRRPRPCPNCGRVEFRFVSARSYHIRKNGRRVLVTETIHRCAVCGHTDRSHDEQDDDFHAGDAALLGAVLGSIGGRRGGFGGGGFSGGSFGGGSFGGGGSGGRF
ncbi:MAG: TPM domain-containing protein [Bacteroidaceae bacterium]|nr:TPM domain-containing protein [Bacteroidaceae bacterium]